jgi:hypothetical protein
VFVPLREVVFDGEFEMQIEGLERVLLAVLVSGVVAWVTVILTEDK